MAFTVKEQNDLVLVCNQFANFKYPIFNYTCNGIASECGGRMLDRYGDFFDQGTGDAWPGLDDEDDFRNAQARLMMLAMFLECEGVHP